MGAKDRLGNTIRPNSHTEGKFTKQTKISKIKLNSSNEEESYYEKDVPREVYTIPWDKKTADSILTGEKYFGADSLNINRLA